MTVVTAVCPYCGVVKVAAGQVMLRICREDLSRSTYDFLCPKCDGVVSREADKDIVNSLRGHVTMVTRPMPKKASA